MIMLPTLACKCKSQYTRIWVGRQLVAGGRTGAAHGLNANRVRVRVRTTHEPRGASVHTRAHGYCGAPAPPVMPRYRTPVILYPATNAFVAMLGLRRRLLAIGLPLWAGLAP